jgi:hypothetical protein
MQLVLLMYFLGDVLSFILFAWTSNYSYRLHADEKKKQKAHDKRGDDVFLEDS